MKKIQMLKSPEGQRATFVEGDMRWIRYGLGFNASQSNVVGHTFGSTPYWYDSILHWQNGRANWFIHSQRLFHSTETQEIEILPTETPPKDAEDAIVIALDSLSLFIQLAANSKELKQETPVYSLAHNSTLWNRLGNLNPAVNVLVPRAEPTSLKDYVVFAYAGNLFTLRKTDLKFSETPSTFARFRHQTHRVNRGRRPNSWQAHTGNVLTYHNGDETVEEDVAELVEGADWKPLIVPAPKEPTSLFTQGDPEYWGWSVAIALGGLSLFLVFTLIWTLRSRRSHSAAIVLPEGEDQAPLSPMVITLLAQRGRLLNADHFDAIVGLGDVASPETRRSRRARIIQVANAETTARFGHPLVLRTKSDTDKRVVLYRIQDFSALM